MNLKEIVLVSGKQGLFKVVGKTSNAIIVESMLDKKRFPAFTSNKVNVLNDIIVFTTNKDVTLKEVLKKIYDKESGGKTIDAKSDEKSLKKYFEEILPDYDKEKVYASDIKKIINWYNLLYEQGILNFEEKKKEEHEINENTISN